MVDTGDLKSPGSNAVWVRVPLRAIFCLAKNSEEAMHLRASRVGREVKCDATHEPVPNDGRLSPLEGESHSEQTNLALARFFLLERNTSVHVL